MLFFSLSVCGCCARRRVGAFAHQKSYVGWITKIDGVVSSSCIGCLCALSHSFSSCYFSSLFTQIVTSLTLHHVLLVSLFCNLSPLIHYLQVLLFARQSIDIWYHHEEKKKQFSVKGISIFLPLFVLTFSFLGVIIIIFCCCCRIVANRQIEIF